jgi:hypothetical protein
MRDRALKSAASGFGVVTKGQQFLEFEAAGEAKIVDALKASDRKDHLRVDVRGRGAGRHAENHLHQAIFGMTSSGASAHRSPWCSVPAQKNVRHGFSCREDDEAEVLGAELLREAVGVRKPRRARQM